MVSWLDVSNESQNVLWLYPGTAVCSHDFGDVNVGESDSLQFTIENTGTLVLEYPAAEYILY